MTVQWTNESFATSDIAEKSWIAPAGEWERGRRKSPTDGNCESGFPSFSSSSTPPSAGWATFNFFNYQRFSIGFIHFPAFFSCLRNSIRLPIAPIDRNLRVNTSHIEYTVSEYSQDLIDVCQSIPTFKPVVYPIDPLPGTTVPIAHPPSLLTSLQALRIADSARTFDIDVRLFMDQVLVPPGDWSPTSSAIEALPGASGHPDTYVTGYDWAAPSDTLTLIPSVILLRLASLQLTVPALTLIPLRIKALKLLDSPLNHFTCLNRILCWLYQVVLHRRVYLPPIQPPRLFLFHHSVFVSSCYFTSRKPLCFLWHILIISWVCQFFFVAPVLVNIRFISFFVDIFVEIAILPNSLDISLFHFGPFDISTSSSNPVHF